MTQILPFMLGEERYALRLTDIQEVIEEPERHYLPAAPAEVLAAVNVHGRILPVINLAHMLGFASDRISDRMIVLASNHFPAVLAVRELEPLLAVDLEQATLTHNDNPGDCISGVLNWQGQMLSLLDLEQLQTLAKDKCSATGGGHAATSTHRR